MFLPMSEITRLASAQWCYDNCQHGRQYFSRSVFTRNILPCFLKLIINFN